MALYVCATVWIDYLWMLLLSTTLLLVIAFYFDILILSEPILYVIMYVWSRREPDMMMNIFGFKVSEVVLLYLEIKNGYTDIALDIYLISVTHLV